MFAQRRCLRWLILLVAIAAAAAITFGAAGGDTGDLARPVATAWEVLEPVIIDGDLADWNTSSPLVLNSAEQLVRDSGYWKGAEDLSATVYLMWDNEALYIAADVTEDSPFGAIAMLPIDDNDNFALYISTNPDADPERTAYAATDFRLILVTDDLYWDTAFDRSAVSDLQMFWSKGMQGSEDVLKGYEREAILTETGYAMEMKIPWSNFSNSKIPLYVPAIGESIGFDLVITDIAYPCPGTEFIPALAWTGGPALTTDPSEWGTLFFDSTAE